MEQPKGRTSDSAPGATRPGAPKGSASPKMPPGRNEAFLIDHGVEISAKGLVF
jgi:hypothetical protein